MRGKGSRRSHAAEHGGKPAAEQTRDENLNRRDHEILRQPREEQPPHAVSHRDPEPQGVQPHVQENGDDQHG